MGWKGRTRVAVAAAVSFMASAILISFFLNSHGSHIATLILYGGLGFLCLLLGIAWLDLYRLDPADSYRLHILFAVYLLMRIIVPMLAPIFYKKIKKKMENCKLAQADTLDWILRENEDTAYGRDHGLSSIHGREEFIQKHPLTDYEQYREYAERIARGEKNVMTKAELLILGLSSGTTGKNKMYPFTNASMPRMRNLFTAAMHIMPKMRMFRIFQFRIFHHPRASEAGVKLGGIGSVLTPVNFHSVVPRCVMKIGKETPSFYVQAVFALGDPEVGFIDSFSPDLLYAFFQYVVRERDSVCEAIAKGHLAPQQDLDEMTRCEMNTHLHPSPQRAEQVRRILADDNHDAMARRLWPRLHFAFLAKSGGFAHSAALLDAAYMKGVGAGFFIHMATEGLLGITIDDPLESYVYVLAPTVCFLEFIPVEHMDEDNPPTLFMEQLEVGRCYEVVSTNVNGLYRNRFGDVILIVGFFGDTPKYKFMYRAGQILTIAFDRTPEKVLYEAIVKFELTCNLRVDNYTATESFHLDAFRGGEHDQGHYVIFMEVSSMDGNENDVKVQQKHAITLDKLLCELHETYQDFRTQGSVGNIEIVHVAAGTFNKLRPMIAGDLLSSQFKMPRVQRRRELLTFLWENRVK